MKRLEAGQSTAMRPIQRNAAQRPDRRRVPNGKACKALHWHGLIGVERKAVGVIGA
ncbi:hypothetical protein [Niveibacterium sp. COAC-50]|uniref:hypothetical protein n=1 Tax=Niveibacterium sp. COAC-50 TaxID=2729384 RepID=UPI001554D388|nr:hypothetical protein [Niveibacterium sp. COAC-50]